MSDNRFQLEQQPITLNADGEITEGKFCAYCGTLTSDSIPYCHDCGEYIVDQGPDRSAILARISRHASGIPSTAGGLIGVEPTKKPGFVTRLTDSRLYDRLQSASRYFWILHVLALSIEVLFIILISRLVVLLISGH